MRKKKIYAEDVTKSILAEPAQGYVTAKNSTLSAAGIFFDAYQPSYADTISLLTSSKKGLSARAALDFLNLTGFSPAEFQDTFKTTVKTIHNYAAQGLKLDASLSEKLLKSFSLFDKGVALFGSAAVFHQWLKQPAYGLGNQLPFDVMDTITGINLIEEELIRLEHGDLA